MNHHFQKVHSDQFKARVVQFRLDNEKLSVAAIGRMIRGEDVENPFPGLTGPYYVTDETIRGWVHDHQMRTDPRQTDYDKMQRLALDVFELCEAEIAEIKDAANPTGKNERVAPDPARLQRLLETSQKAWKVVESAAPDPEPGNGGEEPEPAPEPPADPGAQAVMDAFEK